MNAIEADPADEDPNFELTLTNDKGLANTTRTKLLIQSGWANLSPGETQTLASRMRE